MSEEIAEFEVSFPTASSIKFGSDGDGRITLEFDGSQRAQVLKLIQYLDYGTLKVLFSKGTPQA